MYIIKSKDLIKIDNQVEFAYSIGISKFTLNRILNRKIKCSKPIAYSIVKNYDINLNLEDVFEKL